jgi:cellulose synthase/poly-beta-1,6-N-acetylglucosamine synthase-like glycosyltransferase
MAATTVQYQRVADPWYVTALFYLWLVLIGPYTVFRIAVVNWHNGLGPVALLGDLFGLLLIGTFIVTSRRLYVPVHRPVDVSRFVVDCLIPTHREAVSLIEPTVVAARRVRGIRDVVVVGNYQRDEVEEMCRRLGVRYFSRGTNEFAKAGNLNNGLRHTDADFVMVLDADHMPRPEFLERTLGYLDDPAIAYVQAPQTYYNTESFLFQPMRGRPAGWTELQPFYYGAQLAKNGWEAALFVGSTAVLRRSALDQVGGFAQGTPTEDVHTALRLHARGWRSVFTPEPLAFGLEAANMKEFHTQRHRWAAGTLNLLFRSPDSPLRAPGMTLATRINYLYGICVHLGGALRLSYLLLPVFCLYTLLNPVSVGYWLFGPLFATVFFLQLALTHLHNRGSSHLLYSDAYQFGSSLATLTGAKGVFLRQRHFASSRKVVLRAESHWAKWVLSGMAVLSLGAVGRGLYLCCTGRFSAFVAWCSFFALLNSIQIIVFLVLLRRYERRPVHAPHATLEGEDKYTYVMQRLAAGEIGPPDHVLHRPLEPAAASRPRPAPRPAG